MGRSFTQKEGVISLQFMAYHDEVKTWLTRYYAMRLHELLNDPTESLPNLTVLVNNENVDSAVVQFLGDDSTLIVFVSVASTYYGAVLARSEDWWLPVVHPRQVTDEAIGLADPIAQADMLNYLLNRT